MLALIIAVHVASGPASAQSFEVLGTRAAGMGGAFVAVADDATAVYWNPAGLALGGSYFGLVLDNNHGKAEPEDIGQAGRRSASIIALTAMPVGLSYYRLSATTVTPDRPIPGPFGSSQLDDSSGGCDARAVTHRALRGRGRR